MFSSTALTYGRVMTAFSKPHGQSEHSGVCPINTESGCWLGYSSTDIKSFARNIPTLRNSLYCSSVTLSPLLNRRIILRWHGPLLPRDCSRTNAHCMISSWCHRCWALVLYTSGIEGIFYQY
ncbi:hypothetical protein BDV29DRAFT_186826 [Aspergillus leporis]|uniref:Uncharacterized protein n=1 Tax=Aspergillus leporis TaxID=41062 RepID=A0A5N5WG99_9EURO|nr:hypothetical protein BDV29DRAFT_186826 [Aspergillus leporis]